MLKSFTISGVDIYCSDVIISTFGFSMIDGINIYYSDPIINMFKFLSFCLIKYDLTAVFQKLVRMLNKSILQISLWISWSLKRLVYVKVRSRFSFCYTRISQLSSRSFKWVISDLFLVLRESTIKYYTLIIPNLSIIYLFAATDCFTQFTDRSNTCI